MIMRKVRHILIALCLLGWAGFSAFPPAYAISLKQDSLIQGQTIKLGDVFNGLDHRADKVLGPAPLPGHDMVLNARTLMRIAIALDLPWRPQTSSEYVVLRRAATVIDQELIQNELKSALQEKGITGKYNLAIGSSMTNIILPEGEAQTMDISDLTIKPERNWFEATITAPSKENPLYTARVSGSIQRLTSVPILSKTLRKGDIIGVRDLEFIDIKDTAIHGGTIIDPDTIIGMTPRRVITPGLPLKDSDIEAPQVVSRGDQVTMVFKNGALTLTAQGKALQDGAKGDTIRIVNTNSSKTIQGTVTGEKEVTLETF